MATLCYPQFMPVKVIDGTPMDVAHIFLSNPVTVSASPPGLRRCPRAAYQMHVLRASDLQLAAGVCVCVSRDGNQTYDVLPWLSAILFGRLPSIPPRKVKSSMGGSLTRSLRLSQTETNKIQRRNPRKIRKRRPLLHEGRCHALNLLKGDHKDPRTESLWNLTRKL